MVVSHAHVRLRILTLLLDWKRCSSSQSPPFSVIRIVCSNISAGCGCSVELVILFDTFFISFEISSKISCLLSATSESILFTQISLCFFLGRFINFECCRVCLWISLSSSRCEIRCTSCQRCCKHLQLSSKCQALKELVVDLLGGTPHH